MFEVTQEYILKLVQPKPLIMLVALAALAGILIAIRRKSPYDTKTLAYGAAAITIAFALSFIKIAPFPQGGTVTIASMLPLFLFAYIAGPKAGMTAGLCYGMLQFIQEPFYVHWAQFLLDYPIPFALLGLAGIFRNRIYLGAVVGGAGRFVCHFLSGVVFFAEYAGDTNVYLYSFLYNISYMLPDIAICIVIMAVPAVRSVINRVRTQSA